MTSLSIHHGDCIDILSSFPANTVDLVVTDPPYVCHYRDRTRRTVANDNRTHWISPAFGQIARVMKPDSFCISFYGWNHVDDFMMAWRQCGLKPVGHLVWPKRYASKAGYLESRHEQAFLLAKGNPAKPAQPLPDVQRWTYTGNPLHPTQKAVEIIEPLIGSFSKPGDTVLDPFMGSGTTGVAACRSGRRFVGIEMEHEHFETASGRLSAITQGTKQVAA